MLARFKITVAALLGALSLPAAQAGTDTILHFANLSPYQAKIEFPQEMQDCWHDTGAEDDSRVAEYFDYYRRNGVSHDSYSDYLKQFKNDFGITDFNRIPGLTMANTSHELAPGVNGQAAPMVVFRGETSASLFDGCKLATSSRGFRITLTDADGTEVSRQHYVLQDPPDSHWRLQRLSSDLKHAEDELKLGSGGVAHPLEIALTAGTAIVTVVTIGTAGPEMLAARVLIREVFTELGREHLIGRAIFNYALIGGMRVLPSGARIYAGVGLARGIAARIIYTSLLNGSIVIYNSVRSDSNPNTLDGVSTELDFDEVGLDFSNPDMVAMEGLPDDRSICVYETTTLGIPECRLVGASLSIMPNGALVFLPLPGVGEGD